MFYYTFRGRVTIVYNRHSSSYTTIYYYLPLPYTLTIYLSLSYIIFSKLVWNPLLPLLWVLFYLIFPKPFRTLIMPTFNLLFTIAYTYFFQTRLLSFIYLCLLQFSLTVSSYFSKLVWNPLSTFICLFASSLTDASIKADASL